LERGINTAASGREGAFPRRGKKFKFEVWPKKGG